MASHSCIRRRHSAILRTRVRDCLSQGSQRRIMARPATGTNLNIAELQRILDQRKSQLSKLLKQRTRAQRELDALERSIAKLEGGGGMGRRGGGGGRARNEMSLNETLRNILGQAGKPMSVGDLEAAALAAGYRSSS